MSQQLSFAAEPFSFEFDGEFDSETDFEFGRRRASAPAPLSGVPVTARSVVDPRIDVHAQYALLRLAKAGLSAADDAAEALGAVRAGLLGGIYKEDQRVPALRAKELGVGWWQLIPKGLDAAVVPHPAAAPLIVFRNGVQANAARLDPALRVAWSMMRDALDAGCPSCTCEAPRALPEARALRRVRPGRSLVAQQQATPSNPCDCTAAPPASCATGLTGFAKAICEFRAKVNNQRLICNGQSYWSRLAQETLTKFGPPAASVGKDASLYGALRAHYSVKKEPKTPDELHAWFDKVKHRKVAQADVDALAEAEAEDCFQTAGWVGRLVRPNPTGPNCLGSLGPKQLINFKQSKDGPCLTYKDLPDKVRRMRATLDNGFLIRAGVTWPNDCAETAGHSVLILGHDGGDRFIHWNTVQNEGPDFGNCFGIIRHANNQLRMFRSGIDGHFVVSLEPIPTRDFKQSC